MAAAAVVFLLLGWWGSGDDIPESLPPEPVPEATPARGLDPVEAPVIREPAPPAIVQIDAGPLLPPQAVFVDAGLTERQLIEETMRRWRSALAPLFARGRRGGITERTANPTAITVSGEAQAAPAAPPPAGCEDNVQRMPLRGFGTIDLVVAIDTSGSMFAELNDVVAWLSELELALRAKGVEFQLLVIADRRWLSQIPERRELDGGQIYARIGSTDAFETLIVSAKQGAAPRWTQLLRGGSTKHLVIVTDDEANDPAGLPYLRPLIAAGGGLLGSGDAASFTLHHLGGFEPGLSRKPLVSGEPLALKVCRGGVAPGVGYQRVAIATGGLRASLCYRESYRALTAALVEWPVVESTHQCVWLISPQSVVAQTRAWRGPSALNLSEARSADACFGRTDAYLAAGQAFTLCSSTCAALTDAGYDLIEISTRCVR